MTSFLHQELTAQIIKACFDVSNELGAGFLESVYQNSLLIALRQKGLKVVPQFPIQVTFRGEIVGQFLADFYVDDKVIVEIKAASGLTNEHNAQVINYLKACNCMVGLLLNFGRPRLQYHRLFHPNIQSNRPSLYPIHPEK